jgi:ribose-phosphate pyrophosphokinase
MIIIAGSSNSELAKNIADRISAKFIQAKHKLFEDQEIEIEINEDFLGQDVVIVQSTSKPVNDNLMELLLLTDAAKHANAGKIIALIPYFGYARQNRPSSENTPTSMNLVTYLIKTAGIDKIIALDLHSEQVNLENIDPSPLWESLFLHSKDHVVVSPDLGGIERAKKFSEVIECGLAIINKTRDSNGECSMSDDIKGDVKDKHCIIIDDIVDSGRTLCKAAQLLIQKGASSVKACVTHPVLSKGAIDLIENSSIDELYISNSIPQDNLPPKIKVINIEDLLVNSIKA